MDIVKGYEKEFEQLVEMYEKNTNDKSLRSPGVATIIVSGNKVVGLNSVKGMRITSKERADGLVMIDVEIEDNTIIPVPVHLCTGFLKKRGEQILKFNYIIGDNVKVKFKSHCILTKVEKLHHYMESDMYIGKNSFVVYEDEHFHDENGGVFVETITKMKVDENSYFASKFYETKTRVGRINVVMDIELLKNAKANLESKIYGREDDIIDIREVLRLNGEYSSGIAASTIFATDRTKAHVVNEAYGNAAHARGHIECNEIVKGNEVEVSTLPLLKVLNDKAELTHEASVGRINQAQLETLMAKGLTEDEAAEFIVNGLLS
ncbi:SufB/SufD family protein [Hippea sp. KM1]|uniref:SufB/SufD family protein n=1 Tax=Hippea sp. KM1 TaxID=944481 RepID=UPI00046CD86D|nr:SufD family Fe-S cluster assembly protein [Hippea sp. KM1]